MPVLFAHDIISFIHARWDRLIRYIESGHITPDNNMVENDIRPLAVGRGDWLFAGHPNGASAAATLYSLIAAARASGLDPHEYFRLLFPKIPHAKTKHDYGVLIPGNLTPGILSRFMAVT